MPEPNPYASPQTVESPPAIDSLLGCGQYRRDGRFLVVENGAELPDRCVYCNIPTSGYRKSYNAFWISIIHPACEWIEFEYGICSQHVAARRIYWAITASIAMAVGLLVLAGDRIGVPEPVRFFAVFSIAVVPFVVVRLWRSRLFYVEPVSVSRVWRGTIWIANAGEPFLQSLGEVES